jgi:hypothetical protein
MIDPDTNQPIECYPPRIKAQLVMNKKGDLETDVMDESDVQMNPYDLRKGNMVRMGISNRYAYYKALIGQAMPNEYSIPQKLAMVKRLDTQEEAEGGPLKRTRWAEDEPQSSQSHEPQMQTQPGTAPEAGVATQAQLNSTTATAAATGGDQTGVDGLAATAQAALKDKLAQQVAAANAALPTINAGSSATTTTTTTTSTAQVANNSGSRPPPTAPSTQDTKTRPPSTSTTQGNSNNNQSNDKQNNNSAAESKSSSSTTTSNPPTQNKTTDKPK